MGGSPGSSGPVGPTWERAPSGPDGKFLVLVGALDCRATWCRASDLPLLRGNGAAPLRGLPVCLEVRRNSDEKQAVRPSVPAVSIRDLDRLFNPRRVAVVGAGQDRMQLGHIVLRNLVEAGFGGVVYPINPSRESITGIQAYASVSDTPATPDLAVICTPAAVVPEIVRECGEAGVPTVAVLASGFRETGAEGRELERRVDEERARHEMRLLGPNCLGTIVPRLGLNASFAGVMPLDGHLAFVSQSGALMTAVIDWALVRQIGRASCRERV